MGAHFTVPESRVPYALAPTSITAALVYSLPLPLLRCSRASSVSEMAGKLSFYIQVAATPIRRSTPPPPPPLPPSQTYPHLVIHLGAPLEQWHLPIRPTRVASPPREGRGV
jgi:hypothetical protein